MPSMDFKGKQFIYTHHLVVPFRNLEIKAKQSQSSGKPPSVDDNLVVHGDNLHALKALLPIYAGKIKCIYIDPPYNTGFEGWCYNDKVNSPLMREWLKREANPVDKEDLERHDKWLCMIWTRLNLLKELLAPNGVIFISIDDNEMHHLRCIMDEIFGDKNWIGTIAWKNVTDNNPTQITVEHEYIVCYSKDRNLIEREWKSPVSDIKDKLIEIGHELIAKYSDNEELQQAYTAWFRENKQFLGPLDRYKYIDRGGIYTGSQSVHNPGREGYRYDILHPVTKKPCKEPLMGYRFPESTAKQLLAEGRILFGEREDKIIELKVYAHEYQDKLPSVISLDGRLGAYELKEIFPDSKKVFDNPKPSQLIKQLLSFVTTKNDIVLDSFAGSGTTAQAVLSLNKDDDGHRRFILIECENYADDVTAERVRRVINGVKTATTEEIKNGLGGSFTYCELGDEINISSLLSGEAMPEYGALAQYVFYTATGKTLKTVAKPNPEWYVGETDLFRIHLIYRPSLDFLRSAESALNADLVDRLTGGKGKQSEKRTVVFAAAKFMGQKEITEKGIQFCQLPYAIHRIMGD